MGASERVLGLVTARGGSKGIPRKNLRLLAGKPLIAWTVEAGIQSERIHRVIVSTDDEEIAEVAQAYGAEVPFMRPAHLASDDSPSWQTVEHAIDWLRSNEGWDADLIATLQPTSPLRQARHLDEAIMLIERTGVDTVSGVTQVNHPPEWTMTVGDDLRAEWFAGSNPYTRRQETPALYRLNGGVEITRPDVVRNLHSLRGKDIRAYIMPEEESIDIDSELDLLLAEIIMARRTADKV